MLRFNREFEVKELNCKYFFKTDHRDNSLKKSQWTIEPPNELSCFVHSFTSGWQIAYRCWGVYILEGVKMPLGKSITDELLYVAIFVDSFEKQVWHGYPADFRRNKWDVPATAVLVDWRQKGFTTKSKISNAKQGKICSL